MTLKTCDRCGKSIPHRGLAGFEAFEVKVVEKGDGWIYGPSKPPIKTKEHDLCYSCATLAKKGLERFITSGGMHN